MADDTRLYNQNLFSKHQTIKTDHHKLAKRDSLEQYLEIFAEYYYMIFLDAVYYLKDPVIPVIIKELRLRSRIFIGHGHSSAWLSLQTHLSNNLHLDWEEFNRDSAAGQTTPERLTNMLDRARFAFIVMTGEDEAVGSAMRARSNVIHEVGLFQGRLGFNRAIILLEDGCERFSNIDGLTYIGFPKGNISASFDDVYRVLLRERIVFPT
jgi:hypothetical protein